MPKFSQKFSTLPPYALADVPEIKAKLIEGLATFGITSDSG